MPRYKPSAHAEGGDSGFRLPPDDEPEETAGAEPTSEATADLPSPPPAEVSTVLLLGDHVYLPEDPTDPGWERASTTVRYDGKVDGRRTRVSCHPALALFLQERGQAEILD